jgi:hypothetical protein
LSQSSPQNDELDPSRPGIKTVGFTLLGIAFFIAIKWWDSILAAFGIG